MFVGGDKEMDGYVRNEFFGLMVMWLLCVQFVEYMLFLYLGGDSLISLRIKSDFMYINSTLWSPCMLVFTLNPNSWST